MCTKLLIEVTAEKVRSIENTEEIVGFCSMPFICLILFNEDIFLHFFGNRLYFKDVLS